MSTPAPPVTVAFVLASYRPNEPAGMERAVAALASGLRQSRSGQLTFISREIQKANPQRSPCRPECACDDSPLCRHHHRCTQAHGWQLTQPEPGVLQWHTPAGRTFTATPSAYPI